MLMGNKVKAVKDHGKMFLSGESSTVCAIRKTFGPQFFVSPEGVTSTSFVRG